MQLRRASRLYIGIMSGTSMDGADLVLAEIAPGRAAPPRLLALRGAPYPPELRTALLALQRNPEARLDTAMALHAELGERYGADVLELLAATGLRRPDIRGLGCHGQTVRHRPGARPPWTLQLGDLARVAVRTGITTVGDFRATDLAAGGQGAPLAPLVHPLLFGPEAAVANLGGIANLTFRGPDGVVLGFDTGPGNALLDAWSERTRGLPFDEAGRFAASGTVHPQLLARLYAHPYFSRPPPKSTGRDEFHLEWVDQALAGLGPLPAADVQATLAALTAASLAAALRDHAPGARRLVLCGGGVRNADLVTRIAHALPGVEVVSCEALGVPASAVEALMMAWLAAQRLAGRRLDTRAITGARRRVTLGCVYRP